MIQNYVRLPDLRFIAGSRQCLEIEVYDNEGDALDVSSATVKLTVGDTKREGVIIEKELSASAGSSGVTNIVTVELTSAETEELCGKYIAQIQIIFSENNRIIPAEMLMNVRKRIRGE